MRADFLVIGSGLTGATIARLLADAGRSVLVLERRKHPGGNVHDHVHPSGVRIHTYGPHYFRTNDEGLWGFVNRFSPFYAFEAVAKSLVRGRHESWPVAVGYIRRTVGQAWEPGFRGDARNFEEASLRMMPRAVYEDFVKGYTQKQWGCNATELSASLARRFDVREDDEPRFTRHRYQGIPSRGYAKFMENLLRDIPLVMECDWLRCRDQFHAHRTTVYTGAIDELFGFDQGRLAWRGQRREHEYLPDTGFALPCGQVNNPDPAGGAHIRTLEWKHMMETGETAGIRGTVLTREHPYTPSDPDGFEYPFPDEPNALLYRTYRERADAIPHLLVCGRLGEYRYYDMDQAIARATMLAKQLLAATPGR
jgi:UDP-galactopyranose mutase